VQYLTSLPSPSRVTAFVVDPEQRWVVYARHLDATFGEELWRVSLHSGEEQQLLAFDTSHAVSSLAWSPARDCIACAVTPLEAGPPEAPAGMEQDELWLISPDGSRQERIIPKDAGESIGWRWLYWSQDERFLFANRFFPDEIRAPTLYALDLNTRRLQRITENTRLLDQSRDGTLLLGSTGEGTPGQLWTLDWPTTTVPVPLTPQGWSDTDARWSTDGAQIIFASTQHPYSHSHLWTMNSDGSQRRQLTSGAGREYLPRWLPGDGDNYVLFLCPRHTMWLLEVETGKTRLVVEEANVDYVPLQD